MELTLPKQLVQKTIYGTASKPDVILLCLHGNDGSEFMRANPFLYDIADDSPETLDRFIKLEHDFGSSELAHTTAQSVESSGGTAHVVEANIPRAILDLGRFSSEHAIRPIFIYAELNHLLTQLKQLHSEAMQSIQEALGELKSDGKWLDIHTMSPHNPIFFDEKLSAPDALTPAPGRLHQYIDEYLLPGRTGTRRPINVATHVSENDTLVYDYELSKKILKRLRTAGFGCEYNAPHAMNMTITAANLLDVHRRGTLLDFPKDSISKEEGLQCIERLHQLTLDKRKLLGCTTPIAAALC